LQGSILGLSLFLPPAVNSQSKPVLFASDTDIIIYHPERASFRNINIDDIFDKINK
jgi:tricorn protease-like protein